MRSLLGRFNRTFMELKSAWTHHPRPRTISFNRTFMELKLIGDIFRLMFPQVLIVPLWNWNLATMMVRMVSKSFNRTFMELKFSISCKCLTRYQCFNRTFMELKFVSSILSYLLLTSFNRTFMELKYYKLIPLTA